MKIIRTEDLKVKGELIGNLPEEIILYPEKAVSLPGSVTLIVADLHLGKARHFNRNGIRIPLGTDDVTLGRLDRLIEKVHPEKVVFLGDLFHSELNSSWHQFRSWCESKIPYLREIILIKGNHDVLDDSMFVNLGITVTESMCIQNCLLTHQPVSTNFFNIYGHIHPGIRIKGKGHQKMRLPCFGLGPGDLVLPAFGEFTGLHTISSSKYRKFFAVGEGHIFEFDND